MDLDPLSTEPPPFPSITHPYPPQVEVDPTCGPVPTNAWMTNLFYESQGNNAPTIPDPYILRVNDGYGGNYGLSIRQPSTKMIGYHPPTDTIPSDAAGYYLNTQVVDVRLTAVEWTVEPRRTIKAFDLLSVTLELSGGGGSARFPIVRGMAYVTALYDQLTPQFYTQHAMIDIDCAVKSNGEYYGDRFVVRFNDNPTSCFVIYALNGPLTLHLVGTQNLVCQHIYRGTVRVAKVPNTEAIQVLDDLRQVIPTGGTVNGRVIGEMCHYEFQWHCINDDGKVLIPDMMKVILQQARRDIETDVAAHCLKPDNYFAGKGLQKYALLALILGAPETGFNESPQGHALAVEVLDRLKQVLCVFIDNQQPDPFRYDTSYKGIVARSGLNVEQGGTGDRHAAFGHSYYNDHHYHQGYLVVAAAIVHHLDRSWRTADLIAWTEALIRDVNNPSTRDPFFTVFRCWDWFAGHSWAGGIKVGGALDGRDQESHSEAINFYWGQKLWGLATGREAVAQMATLQLSIFKRAANAYFFMRDDNPNHPREFVKNKVPGIFFEHKVDYTTYFGRQREYIHGIQMMPITPVLKVMKDAQFMEEERPMLLPLPNNPWRSILSTHYPQLDSSLSLPVDDGLLLSRVGIGSFVDDGQEKVFYGYVFPSTTRQPLYYRFKDIEKLLLHGQRLLLTHLVPPIYLTGGCHWVDDKGDSYLRGDAIVDAAVKLNNFRAAELCKMSLQDVLAGVADPILNKVEGLRKADRMVEEEVDMSFTKKTEDSVVKTEPQSPHLRSLVDEPRPSNVRYKVISVTPEDLQPTEAAERRKRPGTQHPMSIDSLTNGQDGQKSDTLHGSASRSPEHEEDRQRRKKLKFSASNGRSESDMAEQVRNSLRIKQQQQAIIESRQQQSHVPSPLPVPSNTSYPPPPSSHLSRTYPPNTSPDSHRPPKLNKKGLTIFTPAYNDQYNLGIQSAPLHPTHHSAVRNQGPQDAMQSPTKNVAPLLSPRAAVNDQRPPVTAVPSAHRR
ncbi:hypothetical protein BZG36_05327, partial [Bifiguratus adelaidae]